MACAGAVCGGVGAGGVSGSGAGGDGTAYTDFLRGLNTACFAGHCDWRIPDLYELQTLQGEACGPSCIGPTQSDLYLSTTPNPIQPGLVWLAGFSADDLTYNNPEGPFFLRAVRGGL